MNNDYIVSILIPVYNGEKTIHRCLESIFSQITKYKYKIFIVNDGSTDNTENILKNEYLNKYNNIELHNLNHSGIVGALNYGLDNITTKYVMRMDVDDEMLPGRIDAQIDYMEMNPSCDILGGSVNDGNNKKVLSQWEMSVTISLLAKGNFLFHPTIVYRLKSLNDNNIRYNNNYKYCEDYWLYCDALFSNLNIYNISFLCVNYYYEYKNKEYYDIQWDNTTRIIENMKKYVNHMK